MKKILLITLFPVLAYSQKTDTLTLDSCQKKALANYPLIKQKDLLNKASEINLLNIAKTYLPQVNLNGQATYQSAVTALPFTIPYVTIPTLDRDMYKATLDVTQVIYDGGLTTNQKKLEAVSLQSDLQSLQTELYKLKDNINTIYFAIVALQENKKLLNLVKEDIKNNLAKVESGVKNGAVIESNADVLKAEIINIDQQLIETDYSIKSGFKMLGDYINQDISEGVALKLPEIAVRNAPDYENTRPELKEFDMQMEKLDVSKSLLNSKLMPKLAGFGQLGYGRPGLNMLSNSFDSFYIIGAKITWNIWDWNESKNEKQLLNIQSQLLNTQKETFSQGVKVQLEKNITDIQKYRELLTKDNDIISLREKITKSASSQLENGAITSTEYLTELNAESQARVNLETHKIQLAKSEIDYLFTKGSY